LIKVTKPTIQPPVLQFESAYPAVKYLLILTAVSADNRLRK